MFRVGSKGRVQRGCPPPPRDEAFFTFTFKICLPHQPVTPFLNGAPPPKKNPGSAPDVWHLFECNTVHVHASSNKALEA